MSKKSQNHEIDSNMDLTNAIDFQLLESSTRGMTRSGIRSHAWRPPTDVYETDDIIHIRVEVAGMQEDNFSIELDGRQLIIQGFRQAISERRAYYQMEIRYGDFKIFLRLPATVDVEKVQANYSNGFLDISMPKAERKYIPIKE